MFMWGVLVHVRASENEGSKHRISTLQKMSGIFLNH